MSRVHPGNRSKNYPTSLRRQDTRAVSHEGMYVRYPTVSVHFSDRLGRLDSSKLPEGHPQPGRWRMKSLEGD
eukprot:2431800-Ditylum_brightwellii.AAC.1